LAVYVANVGLYITSFTAGGCQVPLPDVVSRDEYDVGFLGLRALNRLRPTAQPP
jgi:hypothetical protein